MAQMPHDRLPDSTFAFVRDGYGFISNRCRRYRSDVFETRLLFQRVICMRGAEAAQIFYSGRFQRDGAMPAAVRKTVFGDGGVHGLDGDEHHGRKKMFMSLMTPVAIDDLAGRFASRWRTEVAAWSERDEVVLHDEAARLLCEAVCDWAGVPLAGDEVTRRAEDLISLFDPLFAPNLPYVGARRARRRAEGWIAELVERTRRGEIQPPAASALDVAATHRDPSGSLLPSRVAAVEVLNILRPTVAITNFVVFAALALHEYPEWRQRLGTGGDDQLKGFVQEVRRDYPFFPAVAARVRSDFEWNVL